MKEILIEEGKQLQLGILKNFIRFCEQNQLTYFIAFGTLIGAVRHQGFIPWDDDIDVQMPRPDYEKLIAIYNQKQAPNEPFYLVSPYADNALHSYVKLIDRRTIKIEEGVRYPGDYLGVDIDVFPLDALPDTQEEYDRMFNKMRKIQKKVAYSVINFEGKTWRDRLLRLYQRLLGDHRRYVKKMESNLKKRPYSESKFVGTMISYDDYYNDRHEKKDYESTVSLSFEGLTVSAPVGYDRILRHIYGDYMELPPVEKQVTHHSYTVYWKE